MRRRPRRDDARRAGRVRAAVGPCPSRGRSSRSRWTPSSGRSARKARSASAACSRRSASRCATGRRRRARDRPDHEPEGVGDRRHHQRRRGGRGCRPGRQAGRALDRGRAGPGRPRIVPAARPTPRSRAWTCSRTWPGSGARTRSGWPAVRSPTPVRWSLRAFDAGWGGAVWKTIGEPIRNVTSRLGTLDVDGRRLVGYHNIELISDRSIEVNLAEIAEIKKRYPNQAVVVSLMVESKREAWRDIVGRVQRHRRRRHRAQLRLPPRHERAGHGRRRRPGSRVRADDHRVGDGEGRDARSSSSSRPTSPTSATRPAPPARPAPTAWP